MQIMKAINKVPGGLMVVPLFIGMLINTFTPTLLKIGGFTEGLSSAGYNTVLGMYLFTVGTKMTLNAAPRMLKRGFGIMGAKIGIAMVIAFAVARLFDGDLFGFSTLALMVAFSDTNGGMFMALTSVMGEGGRRHLRAAEHRDRAVPDHAVPGWRRAGDDPVDCDGVGGGADRGGRAAGQPGP